MQNSGIKHRQKSPEPRRAAGEGERKAEAGSRRADGKLSLSLACLAVSVFISWLQIQQSARLEELREKHEHLHEQSRAVQQLEEKITAVWQKCASAHAPEGPPSVSQMEGLDAEVSELKERLSSFAGQRQQLQQNLSALTQAVEDTEAQTLQASSEVTTKVASIRTDVRRMAGLETEVEALLNQTKALEEKVGQTEKLMVKRIGDLLAGSIDRVSALKSSAEKDGQRLDQIDRLVDDLSAANRNLADRILALESGQARLLKMATFAGDLKPKVFTIRQDFALIEPKLDDLTLRIGQLAEDMTSREEETAAPTDERDSTQTQTDETAQKHQLTP